jgi:hypothetical protein
MQTMMKRPQLQDLVKEAMEGAARKVDINYEAARQLANLGEPERTKTAAPALTVTPSEYIEKLAVALDYLAKEAAEDSSNVGPGVGPGALPASAATSSGQVLEAGKSGQGTQQPPKDPPMQSSGVAKDAPTGLQDNMEMMHGEQPVDPMHNEKTSSALFHRNMARLGLVKEARGPAPLSDLDPRQYAGNADLMSAMEAGGGVGGGLAGGGIGGLGGYSVGKDLGHPILGALGGALIGSMTGGTLGRVAGRTMGSPLALAQHIKHRRAAEIEDAVAAHQAEMAAAQDAGPKVASILNRNLVRLGLAKVAEDGDGEGGAPSISAGAAPAQGAAAPPGASPSGEQVPSEPSDVNAQKALISSNEAAINYTKQQAKADPKRDAGHVYDEPALSAAHDSVLQQAFDAASKAGVKISSDLTRVAAAQALLRKYAEEAKEKKDDKKGKEKESQMPGLSTPSGQSGFSASNQGM